MIDIEAYWVEPPPGPSDRLRFWLEKFREGWRRNRRISSMGYYGSAAFFGVYIWEYVNVIFPRLCELEANPAASDRTVDETWLAALAAWDAKQKAGGPDV